MIFITLDALQRPYLYWLLQVKNKYIVHSELNYWETLTFSGDSKNSKYFKFSNCDGTNRKAPSDRGK